MKWLSGCLSPSHPQRSMAEKKLSDVEVIQYVIHKPNSTPLQAKDLVDHFLSSPQIVGLTHWPTQGLTALSTVCCVREWLISERKSECAGNWSNKFPSPARSHVNWNSATILNFNAGTEFQRIHFIMKLMSGIVLNFHRGPMGFSEFQNWDNPKLNFHAGSLRFERICW